MKPENLIIGASSEFTVSEDGKTLVFKKLEKGKEICKKIIPRISRKQAKNYNLIGTAMGQSTWHCLYLASKYAANFCDRITAYSLAKGKKSLPIALSFYEKTLLTKNPPTGGF